MRQASRSIAICANSATEVRFDREPRKAQKFMRDGKNINRSGLRIGRIVAALVPDACDQKPAAHLASWAGISVRAAESILGGHSGVSWDSFFNLLHSPIGRELWERAWTLAPMPDWHKRQQQLLEIAEDDLRAARRRKAFEELSEDGPR